MILLYTYSSLENKFFHQAICTWPFRGLDVLLGFKRANKDLTQTGQWQVGNILFIHLLFPIKHYLYLFTIFGFASGQIDLSSSLILPKTKSFTVAEIPLDRQMLVFTDKISNCTGKNEAAGFFVSIKLSHALFCKSCETRNCNVTDSSPDKRKQFFPRDKSAAQWYPIIISHDFLVLGPVVRNQLISANPGLEVIQGFNTLV